MRFSLLDYMSDMTHGETQLRDDINKELEVSGFHLRIATLKVAYDHWFFDYIPPVDNWAEELPEVDSLITNRIREWLSKIEP